MDAGVSLAMSNRPVSRASDRSEDQLVVVVRFQWTSQQHLYELRHVKANMEPVAKACCAARMITVSELTAVDDCV